jgi:hypothetical protein
MSGLMNMVTKFARGRAGGTGRAGRGARPVGGTGTRRRAGAAGGSSQGAMIERGVRKFLGRR